MIQYKSMYREEELVLHEPNKDGNVWPKQYCPAFTPRAEAPEEMPECWYCYWGLELQALWYLIFLKIKAKKINEIPLALLATANGAFSI